MTNPTHRLKKFVRYSGNGKPDDYYVTEERGWLGSGVTDCNGVEIFEGDIVKYSGVRFSFPLSGKKGTVQFSEGNFVLFALSLIFFERDKIEVIGHVATEEADNDNRT